ncbi:MAG: molybdopterin-dependent oxidoreductase, partial [Sulfurovaceae bacterium]
MKREIESVCTYCGVGCDIIGIVENNKIEKIYAHKEGVVSQGKLCIKGKQGYDFVDSKERIQSPLVKKSFLAKNDAIYTIVKNALSEHDEDYYSCDLDTATTIAAMKLNQLKEQYGGESLCAIGGARTNCESNTIEAHPIIANRIVDMAKTHNNLAVIDVRDTKLSKFSKHNCVIPYEANLLILNMMAYVIIDEELYDKSFVDARSKGFEEFKAKILNDPYANPEFFKTIKGYEYLSKMIPNIAREYAVKRSMIFWGLGVTQQLDGSQAVMAITHLAVMTGNIGKVGAGLMPLRGQNNVQGACDMGCLPYFAPDYQTPKKIGLMTPQLIEGMLKNEVKALVNMGEDILHVHPNTNKSKQAIANLDFLMVQELFMTEIAQAADLVIGVKSAYEKTGVYVNAMRRLHLSQPLVESSLPDDWEVLAMIDRKMGGDFSYDTSEDVWNEVTQVAHRRFSGARYQRLERHRKRGMQWPI